MAESPFLGLPGVIYGVSNDANFKQLALGLVDQGNGLGAIDVTLTSNAFNLTQVGGSAVALGASAPASSLPVTQNASTATLSNVVPGGSSATLLASNAARKGAVFYNDGTVALYISFSGAASSSNYTYQLAANQTLELPVVCFTGAITGLSASGTVRVTELA